jgi:hypothetical protein
MKPLTRNLIIYKLIWRPKMKKWGLLMILLLFPIFGCDSGSNSGGSGNSGINLNGTWTGQWSANVIDTINNVTGEKITHPVGGPLTANLQLNGRQLTGTISAITLLNNQPAQFTATISNSNGNGNIEMGAFYTSQYSLPFYGTYSNQQIYCRFGSASTTASGTIYEGSFTLTR